MKFAIRLAIYCDAEQSGNIVAEIIEKVLYSSNHKVWSHELDKCLKVFNCASHESTDIIMTPLKKISGEKEKNF